MKKLIVINIVITISLFSADIIIKTAGTSSTNTGLSVQDSSSIEIFSVEGDGSVQAKKGRIQDKTGFLSPTASITMFAGSTAPTGWLICDGRAVSRSTYTDLFAVIGETYGSGDGSTTFNIPDMRGKGAKGYKSDNTKFDALGENGGEETHTLTTTELPSHNHTVDPPSTNTSSAAITVSAPSTGNQDDVGGWNTGYYQETDRGTSWYYKTLYNSSHNHNVDIAQFNSGSIGGNSSHNILDPYIVMNYIIKY